ncbi:MAG: DUF2778 domain-containing protein [Burkholderiales bacterium]|nr:DUF2778 domain-containing protein [Burkholderiales bacterium]
MQVVFALVSAASLPTASFAQATSTAERFFNSAADAQNACTAQPVEYYCGPDGQLYQSACNTIAGPHGAGLTTVTRVEMTKPAGLGACYYSAGSSLKYTYFVWRDSACPAGQKFVGPGVDDCVDETYTTYSDDNRKGCGSGDGGGGCNKPKDGQSTCDGSGGVAGENGGAGSGSCSESGGSRDSEDMTGNPINSRIGNKTQREIDIRGGNGVPGFVRTYNSFETRNLANLGVGWMHNWARRLDRTGSTIVAVRSDGAIQQFTTSGTGIGFWSGDPDTRLRLEGKDTSYELSSQDGTVETYDKMGRLVSVKEANGQVTTLDQSVGVLTSVTGPFGHRITFGWSGGVLVSVTDANNKIVYFNTTSDQNLASATYPDGSTRRYLYEDFFIRHGLTGIVDGTNTRISSYTYDQARRIAIATSRAGGVGASQLSFSANGLIAYVTDAAGRILTKVRQRLFGLNKTVAITNSTDSKSVTKAYDAQGNMSSVTNEEGQTTSSVFDGANRLVSITRAAGTSIARTTSTSYADPFFAIKSAVSEPSVLPGQSKTTTYAYADTRFPLLPTSMTVSGFTPSGQTVSRSTGLAYTAQGQLGSIDGPRSDVIDTTTIEYWQCSTGGSCGQLKRITNAVGQATTFDTYDGAGRLTQKTGPDGVVTTYTYEPRGQVASITETGGTQTRTTSFTYDQASRLSTASLPSGQVLTYSWDGADQLLSVADQLGNTVTYGYDLRGNRTSQTVKDAGGNIATQAMMVFDARNFLKSIAAAGGTTNITNDGLGNPISVTDAKGQVTTNQFDALNRLWMSINPLNGTTTGSFTPAGDLATLSTPNGAGFSFLIDDLGNQLRETSPDRGQVNKSFDAAGNLKTRTDARGVTVAYTYDAANRLTHVTYPSAIENTSYSYDSCRVGKLCQVIDASGTHAYQYDGLGRQSQELWTASSSLGGHAFTTSYTWTAFDQPSTITSPTGRVVSYTYDAVGRVAGVASGSQTLVSGRAYRADGTLASQTFGNGVVETRTYDTAGRLATWQIGSIETRVYGRDLNGNITSITTGNVAKNFGYDATDRLLSEPGQSFGWDTNSNRTSDASGTYVYQASTNRMTSGPAGSVGIDAAGNTTSIGTRTFAYSDRGRLVQAMNGGAVVGSYVYRADGLRAGKTTASGTTLFHWDAAGNLIEETTAAGGTTGSYAWVGTTPVAKWATGAQSSVFFLHTDQLGTPRLGTSTAGGQVWRWDGAAFGQGGASGSAQLNLRFEGQFYDAETGLYQNRNRTYDPSSGRYLESDLLGLTAGTNTFAYVGGNPMTRTDPWGLDWIYVQSTGQMYHQPADSLGGGPPAPVGSPGYAGHGIGVNNAPLDVLPSIGPLPSGTYEIGPQQTNVTGAGLSLPGSMRLTPDPNNWMYGRAGFLIHGDNSRGNRSASEGCIIEPRGVRDIIGQSQDRTLRVIP